MLTAEKPTTVSMPPHDEKAFQALANRQARVWVRFGVRVVVVAILSAFLVQNVPFLAANRPFVDALSGVLVLWPLWTQLGKIYADRIQWGKQFHDAGDRANAQKMLAPFAAPAVSRLFDTTGEGTYRLAETLDALGSKNEARALHAQNAQPTEWGQKSAALLQKEKTP